MTTMTAWRFDRYGGPEVLSLQELPMPVPGSGEVLIQLVASGVNPSDVKNVAGHFKTPLPRTPGRDYAGVIAGGDGREGDAVWGSGPGFGVARDGCHATHIVIPTAWVSRNPAHLSMDQAAAVGVPHLAAWCGLITAGELRAGETVLITGVSGSVGHAATQIAHWKKARVIGASISRDNPSHADAVIDTTKQDLSSEVRALTDGRGADLVLDTVGGPLFEPCLKSLARGGRQIAIASAPPVVSFNLVDFYHGLKRLVGVDTMALTGPEIAEVMNQLRDLFEEGALQPPTTQSWAFNQAVGAYQAVATGSPAKHVLVLNK